MADRWKSLIEKLRAEGIPVTEDEPLANHTTFQIGGPAAVFCLPRTVEQLASALKLCRDSSARTFVLGNGSNVLFSDTGFSGCVLCTTHMTADPCLERTGKNTTLVYAPAGMKLAALCLYAQQNGLSGLEFAYGIPGTVGGAVFMNAGAYSGEVRDVLHSATFLDETGAQRTLPAEDLALSYRSSIFEKKPWCITQAAFVLHPGDPACILSRMQNLLQRRKEKQPLDLPSAGSAFKRPDGTFASKLIEDCGLRGFSVGGAAISTQHCGFVINTGSATCSDVLTLTDTVAHIVKQKTGYTLEREIRAVL